MVDGVRTFDPVGAFQRGRRGQQLIAAEEAAAPRRNQLAELNIQQAQQTLGAGQQTQTQQATKFGQQQRLRRATILGQSAEALLGIPEGPQRNAAFASLQQPLTDEGIDISKFAGAPLTNQNLQGVIAESQAFVGSGAVSALERAKTGLVQAQTKAVGVPKPVSALDVARTEKLRAETAQIGKPLVTPPALLADLPTSVASQADAAFVAAGGGDKGVKALGKVIDSAGEQQRRLSSPKILKQNFPKASEAELQQLQATMDAAKTTESGLTSAQKVRTEQIRLEKGKEFQARAIELLQGILENPELADVIGGQEGTGEGFFFGKQILSDLEADAVSDIEEATSILTSGNLDLLSGVLSDTDIALLKDLSSGALKRIRSEPRFRADVQKLIEKLSSKLVVTVNDTAQDRAAGQQGPQEGDTAFNRQTQQRIVFRNGQWQPI